MTDARPETKRPTIPNWVQVATLLITAWSLCRAEYNNWRYASVLHQLDIEMKQIRLDRDSGEAFSVQGEAIAAATYVVDGKTSLPVVAIAVHIQNDSQVPINIADVELTVCQARLRDVCKLADSETLGRDAHVEHEHGTNSGSLLTGIIDSDSPRWMARSKVGRKMPEGGGRILPGQTRTEKFHVLAPEGSTSLLTKFEVSVSTSKSKQRWHGFADPAMCVVGPSSSTVSP